jgi:ATP-dependent Clp protease adaptor protein ClpS
MTVTVIQPSADAQTALGKPARVILYNDDWHTFDDVIRQLVKSGACTGPEAEVHAWTVHTKGRSQVYLGKRPDCERIARVLREIRLQVEVDWDE